MHYSEVKHYIDSFARPNAYDHNAWEVIKSQALKVWDDHLHGQPASDKVAITCKESYLMLVDSTGQLIIRDEQLLDWVHNQFTSEWMRELESIALKAARGGNYEKALLYFNKVLKMNPDSFVNHYRRAITKQHLRHYKGAMEDFNRALELCPDRAEVYVKRARLYSLLDLDERAAEDLNRAVQLNPMLTEAYVGRGIICNAQGDYDLARKDLEKAAALDPDNKDNYLALIASERKAA